MRSYTYNKKQTPVLDKEQLTRNTPLNPNFCYGVKCSYLFPYVNLNTDTSFVTHGEPLYLRRSDGYMYFGYNQLYADDIMDEWLNDNNGYGSPISVLFSSEDCEIVNVGDSNDSYKVFDFSMCGREINLGDYDASDYAYGEGSHTLLTKKEGTHGLPVARGAFAVIFATTDPEYGDSQVMTSFAEFYGVVEDSVTIRLNVTYNDFMGGYNDFKLFINPIYIDRWGIFPAYGSFHRLDFIAPPKEELLAKGRVFQWGS